MINKESNDLGANCGSIFNLESYVFGNYLSKKTNALA